MTWKIPTYYLDAASELSVEFCKVTQMVENAGGEANPFFMISKQSSSNNTRVQDPSSCVPVSQFPNPPLPVCE
ncbi:MAG: hypothetical protein KBF75_12625 [Saprospiraceae bacterium]|nr:hypothetical protein [Saprospiraceae bacterium]